jgi:hypothetical protein
MKHDYGMSARQRFVLGARLLLVAACLLIAGRVVWSRVDTRHVHRITVPGVCLNAPVEDGAYAGLSTQLEPAGRFSGQVVFDTVAPCHAHNVTVSAYTTTTPNHVPGVALLVLGLGTAAIGLGLARSNPDAKSVA